MQATVKDIIMIMEKNFPVFLAEKWDNVGLQLGDPEQTVSRLMIALDLDSQVLEQALDLNADMIITHHPLIFKPLKNLDYSTPHHVMIRKLVKSDVSVYSAHTNLDSAQFGLNQYLAEKLGLEEIMPLFNAISEELYKIVVFVPALHMEQVREAMIGAGAGHIGRYSDCTFSARGTGTFRPGEKANPWQGQVGELEAADEFRLETVAYKALVPGILTAMKTAHPYEEVAFDLYRLENEGVAYCPGRRGKLAAGTKLIDYAALIKKVLGKDSVRMVGDPLRAIETVAVISGSGASFIDNCVKQGIDLLVTGDLKYHDAKNAEAAGLALIDAGHQGTEQIVVPLLKDLLKNEFEKWDIKVTLLEAIQKETFQSI